MLILVELVLEQVQWNRLDFGVLEIPERRGSNPGHGLCGDWSSTWGNVSQMAGLSDRRYPLAHKFP